MKKSKKSSVSWAPDANLCQIRLFSSGDCPSQSRTKDQCHLTRMGSNPQPPPRFRGSHFVKPLKGELSRIPKMNWKCPPKIDLNCKWLVAAGDESNETETQKLREMRVLEAVYPSLSDIPSSPSVSSNIEVNDHDDRNTPLIPITPIEDDPSYLLSETPRTTQNHISSILETQTNENPALGKLSGSEADISAAASAAFTAILKSTEHGSLIDTDLLIQIFKNPEMLEKFMNNHHQAPPKSYPSPVPSSSLPFSRSEPNLFFSSKPSERLSDPVHKVVQQTFKNPEMTEKIMNDHQHQPNSYPNPVLSSSFPFSRPEPSEQLSDPTQKMVQHMTIIPKQEPSIVLNPSLPLVKDLNYYKNLIKQHGGTKDQQNILQNGYNHMVKKRQPNFQKTCMYFNSSKGCRNGTNCVYQHNMHKMQSGRMLESGPCAKRLKLGNEITGRT